MVRLKIILIKLVKGRPTWYQLTSITIINQAWKSTYIYDSSTLFTGSEATPVHSGTAL